MTSKEGGEGRGSPIEEVKEDIEGLTKRQAQGLVNVADPACSIHATWGPPFSQAL